MKITKDELVQDVERYVEAAAMEEVLITEGGEVVARLVGIAAREEAPAAGDSAMPAVALSPEERDQLLERLGGAAESGAAAGE